MKSKKDTQNTVPKENKTKKKQNRRASNPYRALDPYLNLRSRWEEISDLASYANQLSPKDKKWLNKFASEYICADFGPNPIHKSKKRKKEIYDRNNARNRCILSKAHASGTAVPLSKVDIYNEGNFKEEEENDYLENTILDKIEDGGEEN